MLNILIVDDSLIIRKTLTKIFKEMGHTIVGEAKDGKDAYKQYQELMPDLVSMDITMPIMNGIESLKKIKADFPDAKVIMITSHGEEKLVMDAIKLGAKGYILKPITSDKIDVVLKKAFSQL